MTDLRVLSLHQPWASLVAAGVKSIETRSWPTKHRGRIGIASTKRTPKVGTVVGAWTMKGASPSFSSTGFLMQQDAPYRCDALPLGAIVATANLVDCVPIVDDGAARNCVDVRVARPNADAALRIDDEAGREQIRNVRDQVPYGDFTPGRWAWLLDDVKPTTERCPACWGMGADPDYGFAGEPEKKQWRSFWGPLPRCSVCKGERVCDPVPVKGHQGLWKWNP